MRFLTSRDLLGEEIQAGRAAILEGPWVKHLLAGQGL